MLKDSPLISCLCVTENRDAFMPWLLWCYDRQSYGPRELVIVDSSSRCFEAGSRADIRVTSMPPGSTIGSKRNRALAEARGEMITWFDDDDWQHPEKCARLVDALKEGAALAGSREGWFVDLLGGRCLRYHNPTGFLLFNSAGFRKSEVAHHRFPVDVKRASDTRWMGGLKPLDSGGMKLINELQFFWLCHKQNISNPAGLRRFAEPLDRLRDLIGREAWGETDQRLDDLIERLGARRGARPALVGRPSAIVGPSMARPAILAPSAKRQADSETAAGCVPVSVVIKATALDVPYLKVLVRHMVAQARFSFVERLVVVDQPRSFTGKYVSRARYSDEELQQVLAELLREQVIDRVCPVEYREAVVSNILERYFGKVARRVPTHASSGGPIYATLFGMESARTDLVLQMDADVLFHSDASSWVQQALERMAADSRLRLMMTHPGPPAGPPGRSLRAPNAGIAECDPSMCLWRFRQATTRYFLCDRRHLHGRLEPIWQGTNCAPLEQCLSRMLQRENVFRGSLGNLSSWHLHAWHHGEPFPAWAADLARAVELGCYPDQQVGHYDLRLDQAIDRTAWNQVLQGLNTDAMRTTATDVPAEQVRACQAPGTRVSLGARVDDAPAATVGMSGIGCLPVLPIAVIIPVRNRGGWRLRHALQSLRWQSSGRPAAILVVSHGSSPDANAELCSLCAEVGAELIPFGRPTEPWNKPLALNIGIRRSPPEVAYVMTMDADMILAPTFLEVVMETLALHPDGFVLCQSRDLPQGMSLPESAATLKGSLDRLKACARLRPRCGTGGIQAAARTFFFRARGYDEDLLWWGGMDGDMVGRARLAGLRTIWIEQRTFMLHQWHPHKFIGLSESEESAAAQQAWKRNHALVKQRARQFERNSETWGLCSETISPPTKGLATT